MIQYEQLLARVEAIEKKLHTLEGSIILELKQFTEFHTHTLGGKVVWEFPPELNKKVIAAYGAAIKKRKADQTSNMGEEKITMKDELEIFITPGASKVDE